MKGRCKNAQKEALKESKQKLRFSKPDPFFGVSDILLKGKYDNSTAYFQKQWNKHKPIPNTQPT